MNFAPTFADYQQFGQRSGDDAPPGTEQWFNSLTPEQQFQLIGGNLYIHKGDPRYQDLANATHTTSGSDMVAYGPQNTNFGGEFVDPSHVAQQGGATISSWDNHSPHAQHSTNLFPQFLMGAAALLGGGLGANALFGYNGGAGLLGGAAGADVSPGMLSNFTTPEIGSLNLSGLEDTMNGLGLSAGEGAVSLPGAMQNITTPEMGSLNTAGLDSAMSGLTGGASMLRGLVPTSLTGLLQAGGLATSLAGLLGGHGNTTGSNGGDGGNGGAKGGGGKGLDISRGQYTPNPYTQAQLQNFKYAQPRGR